MKRAVGLTNFSILSVNNVSDVQRGSTAHVSGFLSVTGHVERYAPLSLRIIHDSIHLIDRNHRLVHFDDCFIAQLKKIGAQISDCIKWNIETESNLWQF